MKPELPVLRLGAAKWLVRMLSYTRCTRFPLPKTLSRSILASKSVESGECRFERLDHVIGCGHVSGLQVRPDRAAGRYGDARTWRKSLVRALSSLAFVAFPGPDLTDHLTLPSVDLLTRPTFP